MGIVERPDGKIEVDGQVYAVAEGAALFGLPGWSMSIAMDEISLHRSFATYGADKTGDMRPQGGPTLRGVGRIQGYRTKLGVLGAPATLTDTLKITFYSIREDDLSDSDWSKRARISWPLNVIWSQDAPDGRQFEVVIHVPEPLLLEISASAAAGLVERMVFDIRLERAFLPDRERPNGFEDEPAFLPPIDKNGRQPGPNLGYISGLWVRERRVSLKKDGEDDGGESDEDLPAPIPVQANVLAVSPPVGDGSALKMIASRLGLLIVLMLALIIVVFTKR